MAKLVKSSNVKYILSQQNQVKAWLCEVCGSFDILEHGLCYYCKQDELEPDLMFCIFRGFYYNKPSKESVS
mgnify:CR=1 FL=1